MRAAPAEACTASRVIARKSRRVDIAKPSLPSKVADQGEFRVNLTGIGIVVAEKPAPAQAPATAPLLRLERTLYFFQPLQRLAGDLRVFELEAFQRVDDRRGAAQPRHMLVVG